MQDRRHAYAHLTDCFQCSRSAWQYASSFSNSLSTTSNEPHIVALHQALIPNWTSPAFSKFVDATRALVDELANITTARDGKEEMVRCEEIFRQICWLQERFWPDVDGMGEEDESARMGPAMGPISAGMQNGMENGMNDNMNNVLPRHSMSGNNLGAGSNLNGMSRNGSVSGHMNANNNNENNINGPVSNNSNNANYNGDVVGSSKSPDGGRNNFGMESAS
jgi:hypothetical protein